MSNNKQKAILKELQKCSKIARAYLKTRSFNFKRAYNNLQKTATWHKAKVLLIEYFSLTNGEFTCQVCGANLSPYSSTMHHTIYDQKKLFHPKYISFLHYDCHHIHHQENGISSKKRVKVYLGYRGIKIYSPKLGKINLRFEIIVLLAVILGTLANYNSY